MCLSESSIPYFFSQSFFPLGLLAGAFYLENPKIKYLALAASVTGLGFMVNGLGIITFLSILAKNKLTLRNE